MNPAICVITVTLGDDRRVLRNAMATVRNQNYSGPIEHLIVLDAQSQESSDTEAPSYGVRPSEGGGTCDSRSVRWLPVPRQDTERGAASQERSSVYPRLARLFNVGVSAATAPWVSFLDDDNELEPDHFESLMECSLRNGASAVHSGRRIFWSDGEPYLDPVFPWSADVATGIRVYSLLCARGVWIAGTNILLDQADPRATTYRNSTIMTDRDPTFLVDQSVWLLRRDLVLRLPFPEHFSKDDIETNTCPDDKFLEVLLRNDITLYSTGRPTVRYFLGGCSNSIDRAKSTEI